MYYVIRKGSSYFSSNGYVNTSGRCDSATWVSDREMATAVSSYEFAQTIASVHGGSPEEYRI